jgi:hypothetical protein
MKYLLLHSVLLGVCSCLFPQTVFSQTEQLYTPNQVAAANDPCGTINVPVYGFAFNSTGFTNPVFTGLAGFTTSGTYVAADIVNFKLYQTNFSVFNTSNLLATITTGLGPGAHTFPAFSYTVSPSPVARYFWITVDIQSSAVNGHTITVAPLTIAMTTITGTETAATITAGGTQTITCTPLPVELLFFTGKAEEAYNRLAWSTASEINNAYFTVERSADGLAFSELERVNGTGTTHLQTDYAITDMAPAGMTYYRLRQTDLNGTTTTHGTIAVRSKRGTAVYPNPASGKITVETDAGDYVLTDASGKIIGAGSLAKGENTLDLSELEEGLYLLAVNGCEVQKIIVAR